jgi:hypothetical protein
MNLHLSSPRRHWPAKGERLKLEPLNANLALWGCEMGSYSRHMVPSQTQLFLSSTCAYTPHNFRDVRLDWGSIKSFFGIQLLCVHRSRESTCQRAVLSCSGTVTSIRDTIPAQAVISLLIQ